MTDDQSPNLPPESPSPVSGDASAGGGADESGGGTLVAAADPAPTLPPRPSPPVFAGCVAWVVMAMLCCVAAGSAFALVVGKALLREQMTRLERQMQEREETDALTDRALMLLRDVAMHARTVHLETGEFPPTLGEATPDDPWGNPIEYRRLHAGHARVWTMGADGIRGTEDDLELDLE